MSMDVLPALHPNLQRVINEQLASSMPQPQLMDMLDPPPPPFLLKQDLIYKTEAVPSPPPARVNMFTHTAEADDKAKFDDEAVDLDRQMSMLISSVVGYFVEGGPSLNGSRQFRPSRSPARRPRHRNSGHRFAAAPARHVWRRLGRSQPPRQIRGRDASCRGTS
jgi:hypothetical protein